MAITLRIPKGSDLTYSELDGNFSDLVGQAAAAASAAATAQSTANGKADIAHGHSGLAPTGGTAGQVLKKIDATAYNFSWQDDATGTGGTAATQAEAEAGVENTKFMTALRSAQAIAARAKDGVLSAFAVGENLAVAVGNTIERAIGKLQTQVDALIAGKADLLAPASETGTAWTITKAGHTSREVLATNAAAITATFSFTGMAVGDGGVIVQGGAGTVTLALPGGATFVYAPGVTASPTTAGVDGAITWSIKSATPGSEVVRIDYRSQVAAGGASNVTAYRSFGNFVAPLAAGVSGDLTTLNVQPLLVDGDMARVFVRIEGGAEAAEGCFPSILLNGTSLYSTTLDINNRSLDQFLDVERTSATTVRVWTNFGNPLVGPANTAYQSIAVSSLAAGATFSVRVQRPAAQTKTVAIRRLSATVERS